MQQCLQRLSVMVSASMMLLGIMAPEVFAAAAPAMDWGLDGLCDGDRACNEDEIEAMEDDLANEVQVSLLQRMMPDARLADSSSADIGAIFSAPIGVVLSGPGMSAGDGLALGFGDAIEEL